MENFQKDEYIDKIKKAVIRKFPLLGSVASSLPIIEIDSVQTAKTDGENIFYNKQYFESVSPNQRVFILAHEIMHVAFDHIMRSKGKDMEVWNEATDAVINQMLIEQNLPMLDGGINIKEALGKSAEEMYKKLLKNKKEQEEQEKANKPSNQQNNEGAQTKQNQSSNQQANGKKQTKPYNSQHSLWSDAVKEKSKQKKQGKQQNKQNQQTEPNYSSAEKRFSVANQKLKEKMASEIIEDLGQKKDEVKISKTQSSNTYFFDNLGENETASLPWKKYLKNQIESVMDKWSYRRACEENDYSARIEEMSDYSKCVVEVMLDVSGSVEDSFLKSFLKELKFVVKNATLKVGCFDEFFYGFTEIKTKQDIDKFKIVRESGWTENWDLAVRSFSKDKDITKIVFTDGWPQPGIMPKADTKNENITWLVFGNKNFKPCCGKVVILNSEDIKSFSGTEDIICK